jgi:hypothetical protein
MRFSASRGRILRETMRRHHEEHGKSDEERQKQTYASAAAKKREQSESSLTDHGSKPRSEAFQPIRPSP